MIKKSLIISLLLVCLIAPCFLLTGCGYVPTAWVYLKMEGGYVGYTTDQYGINGAHIYYYENEADATDRNNSVLYITFAPRIMGPDDSTKVDGFTKRTTTIDITASATMYVKVKTSSAIYAAEKKIYINGQVMEEGEGTDRSGTWAHIVITNLQNKLTQGNPGGHINGFVNIVEYK